MVMCMYTVCVCTLYVHVSIQNGGTALMIAAETNDINAIKELLKGGANCNLQTKVMPITMYLHTHGYYCANNIDV